MNRREAIAVAAMSAAFPSCKPSAFLKAPRTPRERYDQAVAKLKAATDPYARWCALGFAAKSALAVGADAEAKRYADELHKFAPGQTKDWNYGNAIQDFNIVQGMLVLKKGDSISAKAHLLEAGRSPGSPQMDSFGPNMMLAKALLDAGERDAVLEYFELCRKFWDMHRGRLDAWRDDVVAGHTPDFGANLVY
jgi:hypothetical protein